MLSGVVVSDVSFVYPTVIIPESGVSEELINFLVSENSQGLLSFSFNPIKFTSGIFSDMPRIFQKDVSLLGIWFLVIFDFSEIIKSI